MSYKREPFDDRHVKFMFIYGGLFASPFLFVGTDALAIGFGLVFLCVLTDISFTLRSILYHHKPP